MIESAYSKADLSGYTGRKDERQMFLYYYGAVMFALTEAFAFMWIVEKVSKPRKRKEKKK